METTYIHPNLFLLDFWRRVKALLSRITQLGVQYLCKQSRIRVSLDVIYEVMGVSMKISGCCHFSCGKGDTHRRFEKKSYFSE